MPARARACGHFKTTHGSHQSLNKDIQIPIKKPIMGKANAAYINSSTVMHQKLAF